MVRSFAVTSWLAAQTPMAGQAWRSTNATLTLPTGPRPLGQPVSVTLQVANPNLAGARIVWEARDQEPSFGGLNYSFTPVQEGTHWIEAEVQWPDGRRAFASNAILASASAPVSPQLREPRSLAGGGFTFRLEGAPHTTYIVQASTNL